MDNRDRVSSLLEQGYECLKNVDLGNASRFFDEALHMDFDDSEVLFALKCSEFWAECLESLKKIDPPLQRGDFVLAQWKSFCTFLVRIGGDFERAKYAFRRFAFGMALDFFLSIPDEQKKVLGIEMEFRLGRCRKALGDYETALIHLERATKIRKDNAVYLAELADCYALSGEQNAAKILFREAFFLGPDKIDLDFIESDLVQKIAERVRALNYPADKIAEWIPVYAEIEGVFSVKRELTAQESSRLNSSMFSLENEIRENPSRTAALKPLLLNRYFWVLGNYKATNADEAKIDKLLQKVRVLDKDIYKQYLS
ncbi:MAG TPA: tetratricopeptide repeat protein [Spirochaetales bacterium]|nr:tetratricopeptide repeat protein [Spirochaetales bacterium]